MKNYSSSAQGVLGQYTENNLQVAVKFINELPNKSILDRFTNLVTIAWKYNGKENGMPEDSTNHQMATLEHSFKELMIDKGYCAYAYSRTGNHLKEIVAYCAAPNDFLEHLKTALSNQPAYPIEITFREDPDWLHYQQLLQDFKQ